MSDAPEKIWAFASDIFDNMSVWQDQPSPNGDTVEYVRADLAQSDYYEGLEEGIKIGRNEALREAISAIEGSRPLGQRKYDDACYHEALDEAQGAVSALIKEDTPDGK